MHLAEAKIYGPSGDPDATPAPKRYTVVPWHEVQEKERLAAGPTMPQMPYGGYNLTSRSAAIRKLTSWLRTINFTDYSSIVGDTETIFGESESVCDMFLVYVSVARRAVLINSGLQAHFPRRPVEPSMGVRPAAGPSMPVAQTLPTPEEIEMRSRN